MVSPFSGVHGPMLAAGSRPGPPLRRNPDISMTERGRSCAGPVPELTNEQWTASVGASGAHASNGARGCAGQPASPRCHACYRLSHFVEMNAPLAVRQWMRKEPFGMGRMVKHPVSSTRSRCVLPAWVITSTSPA